MLENVEKLPKNNFKKNAEIELTKIQTADWNKGEREGFLECPTFTDC